MSAFDFIRAHMGALPPIAKFAIGMALIVIVPRLCRRALVPDVVGLLLVGVAFGPSVLDLFKDQRPIADFLGELGKLLLMFFAGLGIDLALFRQKRVRSIIFGVLTTGMPLLLGTGVALALGYEVVPAVVIGSLLASHTLLAVPIVARLGLTGSEPVVIAVGATVLSDTLSLVVFAICVPIFVGGFTVSGLLLQLVEIAVFVPVILFGLSRLGARLLRRLEDEEGGYFILLLAILATAAVLAEAINLPGIVGSFLAGLAVNSAVHDKPAAGKLEFLSNAFFVPIFFFVTGFVIDPVLFVQSIVDHFWTGAGIIAALLVGKWLAAELAGRSFGYCGDARLTMWSLTLPQVAATLAAALVALQTTNAAGKPLLDKPMFNAVLVMLVVSSTLGPLLTQRFARRMALTQRA
ncbi:cation:proton antiporter [Reyranella sp.]|uniref:cation:proton antiporter n=1 Tax=Reyranella sp. TaxID=1929291 RepID=UPI003D101840